MEKSDAYSYAQTRFSRLRVSKGWSWSFSQGFLNFKIILLICQRTALANQKLLYFDPVASAGLIV